MTSADGGDIKPMAAPILVETENGWWPKFRSSKIAFLFLVIMAAVTIKSLTPDSFSWTAKRQKSYRFKGNALGFFMGDLSVFTQSSAEEAETYMVEAFPEKLRPKVQNIIRPVLTLSEKHQVDPFWVLSVMWTESHFRFEVTSNKGAKGLMQVMPSTHAALLETMKKDGVSFESDKGEDYLSSTYPAAYERLGYHGLVRKLRNLEVGIYYLKTLLQEFDHNHFHATIAYNMGPSWTRLRLRNNQPVGQRNHYLTKVMKAYFHITKNLSHNANVSYISRSY
jgi:hypothetical protein